jgi:hypothetical protein
LGSDTLANEPVIEGAGARIQITRVLELRGNVRQKIRQIGEGISINPSLKGFIEAKLSRAAFAPAE